MQRVLIAIFLLGGVHAVHAQSPLLGTLENPIVLCSEDVAFLKVETLMNAVATIEFLGIDGEKHRETIRLQPSGGSYGDHRELQAYKSERPLDIQAFLVPGFNWLQVRSNTLEPSQTSEALIAIKRPTRFYESHIRGHQPPPNPDTFRLTGRL